MTSPFRVFVDSDVIISSLISPKGAAYLLINKSNIKRFISNFSRKELELVVQKLNLDKNELNKTIGKRLSIVNIKHKKTNKYVYDLNDSHIIEGAVVAKSKYLLTYNIKHYKIEKIKKDLRIIIMRPAEFLQFLRNN